jgi:hypothetical protein
MIFFLKRFLPYRGSASGRVRLLLLVSTAIMTLLLVCLFIRIGRVMCPSFQHDLASMKRIVVAREHGLVVGVQLSRTWHSAWTDLDQVELRVNDPRWSSLEMPQRIRLLDSVGHDYARIRGRHGLSRNRFWVWVLTSPIAVSDPVESGAEDKNSQHVTTWRTRR